MCFSVDAQMHVCRKIIYIHDINKLKALCNYHMYMYMYMQMYNIINACSIYLNMKTVLLME